MKKGVKDKITSKMKITNFFIKTQTGEHKNDGGSSKPSLDATTTLPAHPGKPDGSPKFFDNNAYPSPRSNIIGNNLLLSPSLLKEYEPSRNEQNKPKDPIS